MKVEQCWYREPWPWIIIAGPVAVIVAGAITIWIAFSTADGLVVDDYYRQGLAINRILAREENARRMGVAARIEIGDRRRMSIVLGGRMELPAEIVAHFAHVARAGNDHEVRLARVESNRYEATLPPVLPGRWRVSVEDPRFEWRVTGSWSGKGGPFTAAAP